MEKLIIEDIIIDDINIDVKFFYYMWMKMRFIMSILLSKSSSKMVSFCQKSI